VPLQREANDEKTVSRKLESFFNSLSQRKVHLVPTNQKFYVKQLDSDIVKSMKLLSRFFMLVLGMEPSRVSE